MFLYKNLFFFNIFYSFNPDHAYWNQRRLFSGNLPDMFLTAVTLFLTFPSLFSQKNDYTFFKTILDLCKHKNHSNLNCKLFKILMQIVYNIYRSLTMKLVKFLHFPFINSLLPLQDFFFS